MKIQLARAFQNQLADLGYYKGAEDGDIGPMAQNALSRFKPANGLNPRLFVGPVTLTKLFAPDAVEAKRAEPVEGEPDWLAEARSHVGLREVKRSGNNPTIMDWADNLDQWYPGDDVPWCGLFVAHCMAVGAPNEPQDFNRLGARQWRKFGVACEPSVGAVAVFWRTHKTRSFNGHVGFIVGADATAFHILGGNQSDSVSVTRVAKSRLLECRAPRGWVGDTNLKSVIGGRLSTNEA